VSLQRWPLGFADSPTYAAPLTPWASFPPASTVDGQIRRPEELPQAELIAIGGVWRPRGGRQVLARRGINPVTLQSLTEQRAETIGPFPGGLVRAGMRISLSARVALPAITASSRSIRTTIGAVGLPAGSGMFGYASLAASTTNGNGEYTPCLDVLSDVSAAHQGATPGNVPSSTFIGGYFAIGTGPTNPTVDFSLPWIVCIDGASAAETAITITGATWSAGVATYTTSAAHTLAVGDKAVIAGITPSGWNGTFIVSGVPDTTHFNVPMASDPGAYTSGGTSARTSNVIVKSYSLALEG
jgi:hypothetical protein